MIINKYSNKKLIIRKYYEFFIICIFKFKKYDLGAKFELYPLDLLAKDISEENAPTIANGFGGITLAYNVEHKEDVDKVIEKARSAGAKIVKEPQDVFWGG